MVSHKELYNFQMLTRYPLCVQTKEEANCSLLAENKAHLGATTVINCFPHKHSARFIWIIILPVNKKTQHYADWPHGAKMQNISCFLTGVKKYSSH